MLISIDAHIPFPRYAVYATYRDHLTDLVPYMSKVRQIHFKSRQEQDGLLHLVHEWYGGADVPAVARAFLSEDLLTWTEESIWDNSQYTNPSPQLVSFPYEKLTQQPMIYASLGSVQNTKYSIFHCIAAACEELDVQLVIAHGGGLNAQAVRSLPGYPLVVDYAPQPDVLAYASLTITHAGMNTTLDSLSYGVPLVAIPITFEQPGTGARIRSTGVGEVLSLSKLNQSSLRLAIKRVLEENSYRKNALRIKQSILQAGGAKQAANIIEQVIKPQYAFAAPGKPNNHQILAGFERFLEGGNNISQS